MSPSQNVITSLCHVLRGRNYHQRCHPVTEICSQSGVVNSNLRLMAKRDSELQNAGLGVHGRSAVAAMLRAVTGTVAVSKAPLVWPQQK